LQVEAEECSERGAGEREAQAVFLEAEERGLLTLVEAQYARELCRARAQTHEVNAPDVNLPARGPWARGRLSPFLCGDVRLHYGKAFEEFEEGCVDSHRYLI
jgi:hypothetical protein